MDSVRNILTADVRRALVAIYHRLTYLHRLLNKFRRFCLSSLMCCGWVTYPNDLNIEHRREKIRLLTQYLIDYSMTV